MKTTPCHMRFASNVSRIQSPHPPVSNVCRMQSPHPPPPKKNIKKKEKKTTSDVEVATVPDHQEVKVIPIARACGGGAGWESVVVVDVIEQRLERVGVVLLHALVHRQVRVVLVYGHKRRGEKRHVGGSSGVGGGFEVDESFIDESCE